MKRILVVYNPRSSRYADVRADVIDRLCKLQGYIIGKYEVKKTNINDNVISLAKILKDDDLVISAGGDATGVISANAILKSSKNVALAVLPYGNFNDLSHTIGTKSLDGVLSNQNQLDRFHPLEIIVDGQFYRYATCYVTIGMMGEAVKLYDTPKLRQKLKTNFGRKISSYTHLASWYFKNRHQKTFLPEFKLNGQLQPKKTSDYAAINGKYMARIMKGGEYYKDSKYFLSETDRLTSFWRLAKLMTKSIFHHIPGTKTKGDILKFTSPATIELQAEGEYTTFKNIHKIEIRKSKKCLKVVQN